VSIKVAKSLNSAPHECLMAERKDCSHLLSAKHNASKAMNKNTENRVVNYVNLIIQFWYLLWVLCEQDLFILRHIV